MSDLLTKLRSARSEEEREWLVMKFSLESLEPAILEAVWAAAVPQWFDKDFLATLLRRTADEDFALVFEKLISLSFVEVFQGRGYNIHERSRKLLLKHLWDDDQGRFRELNKRAAEYCARQNAADAQWRVATVCHLVLADEANGITEFIEQGITWQNQFEYSNLEALARNVIREAEANRVPARAAAWAYSFKAESDYAYSRYESARKNEELALATHPEDLRLRARALESLGTVYVIFMGFEDARQRFTEAVQVYRQIEDLLGEAHCLYWLGEIHRLRAEWEEARQKCEDALKLYGQVHDKLGEANCISTLGIIHVALNEPKEARQRLDSALALFRQIGAKHGEVDCLKSLGDVFWILGEYPEARSQYEEALELSRQVNYKLGEANSIARLGEVHEILGEYVEAKARTEEALALYTEVGDKNGQGNCLRTLENISANT